VPKNSTSPAANPLNGALFTRPVRWNSTTLYPWVTSPAGIEYVSEKRNTGTVTSVPSTESPFTPMAPLKSGGFLPGLACLATVWSDWVTCWVPPPVSNE
jgi:hypothetical protein